MQYGKSINISTQVRCLVSKGGEAIACVHFSSSAEKPTADLIARNASIIVDLLLSVHNGSDDFEFLAQILNLVREVLDCDKSMCQKQIICQDRSDLQPRERPTV